MSEPININTLDQLNDIIVSVELPLPDGALGVVKMRPLSAKRVREIRRSITWPTPPLKDFKKDGGAVNPVYDLQDKNYIHAEEDANLELASRTLVDSLIMDIPGDTPEDRARALRDTLGEYVFTMLVNASNKINNPTKEDVVNMLRSFRRDGHARASGNGQPVADPGRMEQLVEG